MAAGVVLTGPFWPALTCAARFNEQRRGLHSAACDITLLLFELCYWPHSDPMTSNIDVIALFLHCLTSKNNIWLISSTLQSIWLINFNEPKLDFSATRERCSQVTNCTLCRSSYSFCPSQTISVQVIKYEPRWGRHKRVLSKKKRLK